MFNCCPRSLSPASVGSTEATTLSAGTGVTSRTNSLPRPTSPSPSVVSEKTESDLQVIA